MRAGSLFTGVGGLDHAVTEVFGASLMWACDNDPAAAKVITHRMPDVPNLGDITTVDWTAVEPVELLTGGFPCTDVSAAGKRTGMYQGTRSGLWAHMVDAITQLRPRVVVIENVRGLLTSRGAEPTAELIAAWATRDTVARILGLITSKLHRALREGKMEHVHRHTRDRRRFVGRLRTAVAAVKRADALIVRAIGAVLGTLADLGFDAAWCGLRASDVGACHERFRIFIVAVDAHPDRGRRGGWPHEPGRDPVGRAVAGRDWLVPSVARGVAPNAAGDGRDEGWPEPAGLVGGPDAALRGCPAAAGPAGPRRPGHLAGAAVTRDGTSAGIAGKVQSGGLDRAAAHANGLGRQRAGSQWSGWPGPADLGDLAAHANSAGLEGREPAAGHDLPAGSAPADTNGNGRQVVQRVESSMGPRDDADGRGEVDWGVYTAAVRRWERIIGRPAPVPRVAGPRGGLKLNPALPEFMQGFPAGWITDVPGVSMNDALRLAGNSVNPRQAVAALRWLLAQLDTPND